MKLKDFFFDENHIRSKLTFFKSPNRLSFDDKNFIKGAIIFLIQKRTRKPYYLVLIKRTTRKGDKHSGEMSFPGGKFDKEFDSTYKDTALRETQEELGISKKKIQILGSFDDHITPKMFIISPFVGVIDELQPMLKENREVEEIVKIPITFFADRNNYIEKTYKLHGKNIAVGKYVYYKNDKETGLKKKYIIFGATSHLIVTFIEKVYNIKLMKPGYRRLECKDFEKRLKKKL